MRSLLRFVNGNRLLSFVLVFGVLALAGTWLSHRAGDTSAAPPPTATTASPASSTPGSAPRSTAVETQNDPGPSTSLATPADRLDRPVDPSGARGQHDEAGARQAAIDYLSTVKQRALYLSGEQSREVLRQWTAPGVAAAELEATAVRLDQLRDALSSAGGEVWWAIAPLGVKVEAYAPDRARVSVWSATVMASGAAPGTDATVAAPQVAYLTGSVELQWVDGPGWSVWAITEVPGPTPMAIPDSSPSSAQDFLNALAGFSLIKEHR